LADHSWIVADVLQGKGRHRVESFIHLHPSVQVSPHHDDQARFSGSMIPRWDLQFGESRYVLMTRGGGVLTLTSAWYSPGFAIRLPQSVIHWSYEGELPMSMVYAIVPAGTAHIGVDHAADQLTAELSNSPHTLPIRESKWPDVRTEPYSVPTVRS
jgi:hypothetical protein